MSGKWHRGSDTVENQSHLHGKRGEWERTKDLAWANTKLGTARVWMEDWRWTG